MRIDVVTRAAALFLLLHLAGLGGVGPADVGAWVTNVDGVSSLNDQVHSVTTDANGDVIAVGVTQNTGSSSDFTVVKLSGPTGTVIWRKVVSGSATVPNGEGRAVTADAVGDVIVVGTINNTGSLQDFAVVKLSGATGAERWRHVINGTASLNDLARSVRIDAAGDVIAGGQLQNSSTGGDFVVVKVSGSNGAELWRRQINGTGNLDDLARSVRLDAAGDVIAGGELRNVGSTDFAVVKISGATGIEMWRYVVDGTAKLTDVARSIRVDSAGNVVAVGELLNTGTGMDFTVVKLAGATGTELWRRQIDGTASLNDLARSVRVDAAGDVVAVGELQNTGTGLDFVVVKLSGSTGVELWRRLLNGTASGNDAAHAVRMDNGGDVLASGAIQNVGTDLDFAIVRLSGVDGSILWRRAINGSGNGPDQASALGEDAAGDLIAAGFMQNTGTNMDFTVVKLHGADGTDFVAPTTTTTTTTLLPPSCSTLAACRAALRDALPAVVAAPDKSAKRVAKRLTRLDRKLDSLLSRAASAAAKTRPRLYARSRLVVGRLYSVAQQAESAGTLTVPLGPIAQAVSGLYLFIPT